MFKKVVFILCVFSLIISWAWLQEKKPDINERKDQISAVVYEDTEQQMGAGTWTGVMMQFFHWYTDPIDTYQDNKKLWDFLRDEADHLRWMGIDAVWIPPAYKGKGGEYNVGYGVYDHFDLGEFDQMGTVETKYGSKQNLHDMVNELHGFDSNGNPTGEYYIQVIGDIVMNHKDGADATRWVEVDEVAEDCRDNVIQDNIYIDAWVDFNFDKRNNQYSSFKWTYYHFDAVGYAENWKRKGIFRIIDYGQEKEWDEWVSLERCNYDFLMGCDLDFQRDDVKGEMKYWGVWFTNTVGVDGFRLDATKHINTQFIGEWLKHVRNETGKDAFAVSEYWSGDKDDLNIHIDEIAKYEQAISVFDAPLHYKFYNAGNSAGYYDLRELNEGTMMEERPMNAVTFVENHDTQEYRSLVSPVQDWFKPLAYAYILFREKGYPCIFFPDYYGAHSKVVEENKIFPEKKPGRNYLDIFLKLREQFALGSERYYEGHEEASDVIGFLRMGDVSDSKGVLAVVINDSVGVKSVWMDTDKPNKKFRHLATIKYTEDGFLVCYEYDAYGDKMTDGIWPGNDGYAEFVADGKTVAIWIEDDQNLNMN